MSKLSGRSRCPVAVPRAVASAAVAALFGRLRVGGASAGGALGAGGAGPADLVPALGAVTPGRPATAGT
ncbi:hypothetical protein [Streptomyces sp. C8S0]|uniref:hypothetical protein n=1 Tax=Streptomyces sp. C8S0 TaxID=2585716 RepID=UPI00125CF60A|nr:hypothetical protein [Streptomyces sp. C8S0]